ncbi:MAG: hypothetical protein A2033_03475 [Bacteroidetes bacterium GWA2_31_9]|nr:MAG: hypothetical protein A2033_03475 [Bacteroidetes bacterium GWA2_31_9]
MSNYKIFLNKKAELDINEVAIWYELKSQNLGIRFLDYFDDFVRKISQNPFLFKISFDNFRTAHLIKFPYIIFYVIDEVKNEVEILGVYHTSRNPIAIQKHVKDTKQ